VRTRTKCSLAFVVNTPGVEVAEQPDALSGQLDGLRAVGAVVAKTDRISRQP